MLKMPFKGLLTLFLCTFMLVCQATKPADLYMGEVPVASTQDADREVGIQKAFAQVIVKLTGKSQTGQLSAGNAGLWVSQYRYEEVKNGDATTTILQVNFDPKAVDDYLRKNNLTIWSAKRPLTLVWLAVEENGTQAIVGEYEMSLVNWQKWVMQDTQNRGMPVLFPLLDLTDQQQVSINDVWYHASDKLQQASNRYQAESVLSGRVYQNTQTQNWAGDWMLSLPNDKVNWQIEASTKEALIADSMNRFADELALRANVQVREETSVILKIDNIRDTQSYAQVLTFLQGLDAVDTVMPTQLQANQATFAIDLVYPLAIFKQALATDNTLQVVSDTDPNVLHYRYL
jgi:uncharacterized protein